MVSARTRCLLASTIVASLLAPARAREHEYYRLETIAVSASPTHSRDKKWKPAAGKNPVLEVSGIAPLDDGRIAVSVRAGEVWFIDGITRDADGDDRESIATSSPPTPTYHLFASGLHEPMGLVRRGSDYFVVQRTELTRLRDLDGDDVADEYSTIGKGWGCTGNYHEYAYGPEIDRDGNFWITLNSTLGKGQIRDQRRWRGWAVRIDPTGALRPVATGFRSPCGIGQNAEGDLFATDQQGNWIATCSLLHIRPGVFFGHPDGLRSTRERQSTVAPIRKLPSGLSWPKALRAVPQLRPPAVWFPYKKAGQSATDVVSDSTGGRFGPFAGQLFVGEFRLAAIYRVSLEKVNGDYQGAVFPFRHGFASAVVRLGFTKSGSLYAGLTNRGWSSIGGASYGLQRLVWTGETPFEIRTMSARPDGFELEFTVPVEPESASSPASYTFESYTYLLHEKYGSDEIDRRRLAIRSAVVSNDARRVRLELDGLRDGYVHELRASGVRAADGRSLLHDDAYYTLNARPTE